MLNVPQVLPAGPVTLRPFGEGDLDAASALFTHPEVSRTYMLPDFRSQEEVRALFERLARLSRSPERFVRGVSLSGSLIGLINEVHVSGGSIELGWAIHPRYWGQGYASAAASAAIGALFAAGFDTVRAGAFEENPASLRVMEKCGMQPTGETEEIAYRGRTHRCVCCAISREPRPLTEA
ncbi:MAG: GNAT family N-acetyltransferase [Clostridia bacterium]|nr:GNAT family N-acetyltransferase [Clostridia bacterium]